MPESWIDEEDEKPFNGIWEHTYICQECGFERKSSFQSFALNPDGTYKAPDFKAKNCPKCKSELSFV